IAHIDCMEVVGIIGENFTFPVQIDQRMVEIVWKRNRNKVVEWEGINQPTYFGPLGNRSVLTENGSLTIVNLEKDDAGSYELQYWDYAIDQTVTFQLVVLDSLPEPEISCNTSNGKLVLNYRAHFQRSLDVFWNFSNNPHRYQNQELSMPLENVDATTNVTCTIKFSQMERSSEISLNQCLP
ncbi:LFA3 protein, partial [Sitta europaea]|nr:LFA3 protein [Sitta europaea]